MADTTGTAAVAQRALELIPDGSVVGLGTGRAATAFAITCAAPATHRELGWWISGEMICSFISSNSD